MDYFKNAVVAPGAVIRLLPPLRNGVKFFAREHYLPGSTRRSMCVICDWEKERNKMSKQKLEPCLVPESAWGQSLANLHKKGRCKYWPNIKDEATMTHGEQCVYCEASPEHGHEVWQYDDRYAVMTLVDVVPVCKWCHHVIHLGHSEMLASKGKLDLGAVLQHFGTVRGINKFEVQALAREAFDLWEERSRKQWTVEFGKYEMFIHEVGGLPPVSAFDDMPVTTDRERIPSQTTHVKWLSVRRNPEKLSDGKKTGHFLLSGQMGDIDKIWPVLARMTLAGQLGEEAYCSTAAQKETASIHRETGLAGVVLGLNCNHDEIEAELNKVFGRVAKSIRYKRPG